MTETVRNKYHNDMQGYIKTINGRLSELCSDTALSGSLLHESMRYSLFAGGKRIRPLLMISACRLLGTDHMKYVDIACSIEMIHTYSLIHDDLPSIDNDDYRRGVLTNHRKYGEGMAVFAGDALLNKAASILMSCILKSDRAGSTASAALYILDSAGADGMLAGQAIDIANKDIYTDIDDLRSIYSLKTGKLIKASLCCPAILEDDTKAQKILERIADAVGLAFQIRDDILDIEGQFADTGKTTGRDIRQNKTTYVSLLGMDEAKIALAEQVGLAMAEADTFGKNSGFLKYLISLISGKVE
jgi:geranylgeranyl diphosphate synthase, type II